MVTVEGRARKTNAELPSAVSSDPGDVPAIQILGF